MYEQPAAFGYIRSPIGIILIFLLFLGCLLGISFMVWRFEKLWRRSVITAIFCSMIPVLLSKYFGANVILFGNAGAYGSLTFSPLAWGIFGFIIGLAAAGRNNFLHGLIAMVALDLALFIRCAAPVVRIWPFITRQNFSIEMAVFTLLFAVLLALLLCGFHYYSVARRNEQPHMGEMCHLLARESVAILVGIITPMITMMIFVYTYFLFGFKPTK